MSDTTRIITAGDMHALAKKLRLKAYYDVGHPEGESDYAAATRSGRSSALIEVAEAIDEVTQLDSELTQDDLSTWRR